MARSQNDDPALTGRTLTREPVQPVLLLGHSIAIIARPWGYGEHSGLTAERVFIRVDGYGDSDELVEDMAHFFPDVRSEELARMLDNGVLERVDGLPLTDG
jgi:hypothetical protein